LEDWKCGTSFKEGKVGEKRGISFVKGGRKKGNLWKGPGSSSRGKGKKETA